MKIEPQKPSSPIRRANEPPAKSAKRHDVTRVATDTTDISQLAARVAGDDADRIARLRASFEAGHLEISSDRVARKIVKEAKLPKP